MHLAENSETSKEDYTFDSLEHEQGGFLAVGRVLFPYRRAPPVGAQVVCIPFGWHSSLWAHIGSPGHQFAGPDPHVSALIPET